MIPRPIRPYKGNKWFDAKNNEIEMYVGGIQGWVFTDD